MKYFPHTDEDIRAMLSTIGVKDLDALYDDVPEELKLKGELNLPPSRSEIEVRKIVEALAADNRRLIPFAGAGAYDHYTPSVIPYIASRSEFSTSYTPYQAEISQGTLQYIFEYQTMMAHLTGMDLSNASMYDGATATAEAMLMSVAAAKKRNRVLLSATVNPDVRRVVETYASFHGVTLDLIPEKDGATDREALSAALAEDNTAGVIVAQPNYYGIVEDLSGLADECHAHKALLAVNAQASSLGLLRTPGEWGADIACGDAQSLGLPLNYGGPYIGYLCVKSALVRKMPGRLVGQTVDTEGRRAFVLTMQAREQHIRREKATSNICTAQGIMCLYVAAYLSLMGPKGLTEVCRNSYAAAHYLYDNLCRSDRFTAAYPERPFFNEFAVRYHGEEGVDGLLVRMAEAGILAGVKAEGHDDILLIAATEQRTAEETARYLQIALSLNHPVYSPLIFELSRPGRVGYSLPENPWKDYSPEALPEALRRESKLDKLPECDELTVVRHYTNMSNNNFGVDTGFYPLGSCTMKYNPKLNEELAALPGFTRLHPATPAAYTQGALKLYDEVAATLAEIAGLSRFTLNPYAGAHGELTGLMVIRTYHLRRGDEARRKIIVPDSAHGTNPASAAVCGLEIVQVKSLPDGTVDLDDLRPLLGSDIAGMMMTNPNTLGIFERQIPEIARLVHDCGGLMYYDGANLNPMLGVCRPGDMGFDVMHINLHKTFSTPHGGGGPGAGPVGVRAGLEAYLPNPQVVRNEESGLYELKQNPEALGSISSHLGNYGILIRAYAYLLSLGREGIPMAGKLSVLNANYIKEQLKDRYELPIEGLCKHEFVFDGLKETYGGAHSDPGHVTTLEVAKRLLDYGFHAPTIYFPLLFHEAMMIEPTETESRETIDSFIEVMKRIADEARDTPELLHQAPHNTPVKRLDDVKAVKDAKFTF